MGPLVAGTVEKVIAAVFRDKGGGGLLRSVRDWLESSVMSEVNYNSLDASTILGQTNIQFSGSRHVHRRPCSPPLRVPSRLPYQDVSFLYASPGDVRARWALPCTDLRPSFYISESCAPSLWYSENSSSRSRSRKRRARGSAAGCYNRKCTRQPAKPPTTSWRCPLHRTYLGELISQSRGVSYRLGRDGHDNSFKTSSWVFVCTRRACSNRHRGCIPFLLHQLHQPHYPMGRPSNTEGICLPGPTFIRIYT